MGVGRGPRARVDAESPSLPTEFRSTYGICGSPGDNADVTVLSEATARGLFFFVVYIVIYF